VQRCSLNWQRWRRTLASFQRLAEVEEDPCQFSEAGAELKPSARLQQETT